MSIGEEYLLLSLTKLSSARKVRTEERHYAVDDLHHGISGIRMGSGRSIRFILKV
jgi:hypothetical protein